MVVAWPPCPTTTETSGITSVWASQECSSTLAGARSRAGSTAGPVVAITRASSGATASRTRCQVASRPLNANVLRLTSTVGCDGVAGTPVTTAPVWTTSPWPESRLGDGGRHGRLAAVEERQSLHPAQPEHEPERALRHPRQQVSKECSRAT